MFSDITKEREKEKEGHDGLYKKHETFLKIYVYLFLVATTD